MILAARWHAFNLRCRLFLGLCGARLVPAYGYMGGAFQEPRLHSYSRGVVSSGLIIPAAIE
jgi:hypothetical protein